MNVSFEDVELEKLIITHQSKKYKKYTRDILVGIRPRV